MPNPTYIPQDFKSDQYVRWCPGCGNFAILNAIYKALAEVGVSPANTAVISGIGCSSRLSYYMNTYGFHTIHGRATAIATGVKVANPALSVWQFTGDGDCLAIGGNHFIHALRRNIDINIVLHNNEIYGLTKGQFSPTSPKGMITKSSPYGTIERPFKPAELIFGAGGTFFARTVDVDIPTSVETMVAAAKHHGTSVVEVLQNCVIFNDGAYKMISTKELRAENVIFLKHGEPMLFGKNKEKGLTLEGFNLKAVSLGGRGVSAKDVLIHDATTQDFVLHQKLAAMSAPDLPIAMGVIRNVEESTYDDALVNQIHEVQSKSRIKTFEDLLDSIDSWEI
ncbi:2-oxoacid:ferredoxin oxidoreductase subunit beta [Microbacter margulisiae]|uniref:2-oxoglutarate ferredoxin oxidoreductase subunit beta n=1 Tax=Microbacter margulisiae TaxID=1350067 RepID=A0A7W5DS07_9PORP|nr:2-oxoacid:ferredoxin oxidoreductase subunit beta [Microbacter margulisiae]MBB3188017.1 2-oxoglutarate ferredoxin oxidoreductase subunit beta [Microbacter margulisiae]